MNENREFLGEFLIFIISQPRAGSTLLQRILATHPQVYTLGELWLMLHPVYALRKTGLQSEYDSYWAHVVLQDFLTCHADGETTYIQAIRALANVLYGRALQGTEKEFFLDKTPRYYFIIPDLYRIFPKAHYIILLRNPLAVLCSVVKTWIKEDWFRLYRHKHDLVEAPQLLLEGVELLGNQGVVVHYEQLLKDPASEVQRICDKVGMEFIPEMIEYGRHSLPHWSFGDLEGVCQHTRPALENMERWRQALNERQVWRLANDYLQLLGQETIEQMGYSYEELRQVLEAYRPHWIRLWLTFPLDRLLRKPIAEQKVDTWHGAVITMLLQRGVRGTAIAAARKIARALSNVS